MNMDYIKNHKSICILSLLLFVSVSCNCIMFLKNVKSPVNPIGTYQSVVEFNHGTVVIGEKDGVIKCFKNSHEDIREYLEGDLVNIGNDIYMVTFEGEEEKYYLEVSKRELLLIGDNTTSKYRKIAECMMFSR